MDIQLPQIIFQLINFSVVLGGLIYLLYKPVQKILDERATKVAASLDEVEKIEAEKEKIQALKAKTKREAEKEAAKILEEAKKTAAQKRDELVTKTKKSLQQEMKKAEAAWKEEKQQLIADSKKEMVTAVIEVSKLVIGKKLDKKTDQKLIADGLQEALKNV
jgi:F-type H+-transporting ATPase subunit b